MSKPYTGSLIVGWTMLAVGLGGIAVGVWAALTSPLLVAIACAVGALMMLPGTVMIAVKTTVATAYAIVQAWESDS